MSCPPYEFQWVTIYNLDMLIQIQSGFKFRFTVRIWKGKEVATLSIGTKHSNTTKSCNNQLVLEVTCHIPVCNTGMSGDSVQLLVDWLNWCPQTTSHMWNTKGSCYLNRFHLTPSHTHTHWTSAYDLIHNVKCWSVCALHPTTLKGYAPAETAISNLSTMGHQVPQHGTVGLVTPMSLLYHSPPQPLPSHPQK